MAAFPLRKKRKTLFCSTPGWGVHFAEGSTVLSCFSTQSWDTGHQLSWPCRVLAAVCSLIYLWAGPAGAAWAPSGPTRVTTLFPKCC